jgi:hypothetical protein
MPFSSIQLPERGGEVDTRVTHSFKTFQSIEIARYQSLLHGSNRSIWKACTVRTSKHGSTWEGVAHHGFRLFGAGRHADWLKIPTLWYTILLLFKLRETGQDFRFGIEPHRSVRCQPLHHNLETWRRHSGCETTQQRVFLSMATRQSCRCCPWPSGSAARRTKSWSGTAPLPPPASWTVLTAFSDRAELPARSFEKGVDEVKPFDVTSIE